MPEHCRAHAQDVVNELITVHIRQAGAPGALPEPVWRCSGKQEIAVHGARDDERGLGLERLGPLPAPSLSISGDHIVFDADLLLRYASHSVKGQRAGGRGHGAG